MIEPLQINVMTKKGIGNKGEPFYSDTARKMYSDLQARVATRIFTKEEAHRFFIAWLKKEAVFNKHHIVVINNVHPEVQGA